MLYNAFNERTNQGCNHRLKSFKLKIICTKHINNSVKQNHRHDYTKWYSKSNQQMNYYCYNIGKMGRKIHWITGKNMAKCIDTMARKKKPFPRFKATWSLCLRLPIEWHAIEVVCIVHATASCCCDSKLKKVAEARLIMLCFACTQLMHTVQTTYLMNFFLHWKWIDSNILNVGKHFLPNADI